LIGYWPLMVRRRIIRAFSERLPSGIHRELVSMLYTTIAPLILVGGLTALIGTFVAFAMGSVLIACLAGTATCWTALRIALLRSFRRRSADRQMQSSVLRRWERLYAIGSIGSGLLLGMMNCRVLMGEDAVLHMLMSALTFGYGAGLVVRVSVRPWIYAASLAAAVLPSIAGLTLHLGEPSGHSLAYAAMGLLYVAFAAGSTESARFLYRSTVKQLVTSRNLAGLARQDVLTGLANRLLLRERLDESIASISHSRDLVALHILDLDHFKPVNDGHGHPTGDLLLKEVARRITRAIRPGDTAGRLGGDEFAVIQTSIRDEQQALALGHRIADALKAPFDVEGVRITIGTSIGIAFAPRDGLDLEALSARADAALYAAKAQARGTVLRWDDRLGKPMAA
jgi:diguanylate cyclase